MQYDKAVSTITSAEAVATFMLVVIAGLVLFILVGQGIKMWRDLFGKPKEAEADKYKKHCKASEERFQAGESRIDENSRNIADLREGQRAMCVACMALLNHELHNGNAHEMEKALSGLNQYLLSK